jgi:hypothetical protein
VALDAAPEVESPPAPPPQRGVRAARQIAQGLVALAAAAAISGIAWKKVGSQLSITTDIVGSTTFSNYDIYRLLDHLYIATLLFPALGIVFFLALGRWGALAQRPASAPWPPPLRPPVATEQPQAIRLSPSVILSAVAGLVPPALVIAVEVGIASSPQAASLSLRRGAAAGVAYGAVVAVVSTFLAPVSRWRAQWRSMWSAVNAFFATLTVLVLLAASDATAVTVVSNNHVVRYPWLPAWVAVAVVVGVLALAVRTLILGGWAAARRVERTVLLAICVPLLLFLLSARMQLAQGPFNGFDDAQSMVGAHLMFDRGLWPWRDLFLLHGFFLDGLYGAIGMWVFGPTRWGVNNGGSFLVAPLTAVSLYGFILYFARRNYAVVLAGFLALAFGLFIDWSGTRFVLMPPLLILFDLLLRRATWGRCCACMGLVVLTSIVTPESTILVLGILATLALAEAVHASRARRLRQNFRRTLRCAAAGVALTGLWVVFLAATGCLRGFVAYYLTTIRGHELWGALPVHLPLAGEPRYNAEFVLPVGLLLLTAAKVAWKLHRRSAWQPVDWVMVGSATAVPLIYQVALGRFDAPHVGIAFQAVLPLVVLWTVELIAHLDRMALNTPGLRALTMRLLNLRDVRVPISVPLRWSVLTPGALLLVIAVAVLSPYDIVATWSTTPNRFHAAVPEEPPTAYPLGYTEPGTVDIAQIDDLKAVINRYSSPSDPVFEFANEMGVPYFLLDRLPAARFYHVESAQNANAQQLEIEDLQRSRPRIVIFNDTSFGLPDYDGIWSMERNYLVSQYLLDNYRPIADVQGQLMMLRSDLVETAPPLPPLHVPARPIDPYFADIPACNWGYTPDFLTPPTAVERAQSVVVPTHPVGHAAMAVGWAYDSAARRPPLAVVAASNGKVVASTTTNTPRTDVAAAVGQASAATTGWSLAAAIPDGGQLGIYAINADGTASELTRMGTGAAPTSIQVPNGPAYRVVRRAASGYVDAFTVGSELTMQLPPAPQRTAYRWLEFDSPSGFGDGTVTIGDKLGQTDASHLITFRTLPRAGNTVYLRVGSCIQWHGYTGSDLTLVLQDMPSDITVRLLP